MSATFHLSIGVQSLEASLDFFVRVLKCTILHQDPTGYVNIDFYGSQITLKENGKNVPELQDFHFGMNTDLDEFDRLVKNIRETDPSCMLMEPQWMDRNTPLERKKVFLKCPTGYLIEFKGYK